MRRAALLLAPLAMVLVALSGWKGVRLPSLAAPASSGGIPATRIKRGDVAFAVTARGELQGGNSEMLTAPMTGGSDMVITTLRQPGELVEAGDVVVQFDTTEQVYKLKEAEADLAEAEQHVIQAEAESQAKEEEARYALLQAKADLRQAELEARRNPLVAAIIARQNELAVEAARDKLRQLENDLASRKATTEAGVAIHEAARNKARAQAQMARQNIEAMTLRARSGGYVNVQPNLNSGFLYPGLRPPIFQVGDTVRAGIAVAQIPDLKNGEVSARISELDRGHIAPGQPAKIRIVALPGHAFAGKVKSIGGTTGPPWDRHFDCRIALDEMSPELRPGMSSIIVITTETMRGVLWAPAQALFESDGRTFVYLQSPGGFVPKDVKLVRRSESQVVLENVAEGQMVATASPVERGQKKTAAGAMKALAR